MYEEIESQEQPESLVNLRLITHNARLVDARKEHGMNGDVMSQAIGMARSRLRRIETLKYIPTEDEMVKFASILEKPIEYLFPDEILSAIKAGAFSRRKAMLTAPQIVELTEALTKRLSDGGQGVLEIEEHIDNGLLSESLQKAMKTLTPRERLIIDKRFGLIGGCSQTLEEVGRDFSVTRTRIEQIERKALKKLRHRSRSCFLKDFLELDKPVGVKKDAKAQRPKN